MSLNSWYTLFHPVLKCSIKNLCNILNFLLCNWFYILFQLIKYLLIELVWIQEIVLVLIFKNLFKEIVEHPFRFFGNLRKYSFNLLEKYMMWSCTYFLNLLFFLFNITNQVAHLVWELSLSGLDASDYKIKSLHLSRVLFFFHLANTFSSLFIIILLVLTGSL